MERTMQRRVVTRPIALMLLVALAWVLPAAVSATDAPAQVRIPAEALVDERDVQEVLAEGQTLEKARRWGEALSHYEDAARTYPDRQDIEQRLTLARIHFDLARRYADRSFLRTLTTTTERDALELYSEVLLKIQTHYVTIPDWRQLLRQGTVRFDVALTEDVFVRQHLSAVPSDRIDAFRRELYGSADWRTTRSRKEARDVVARIAQLASQRLGVSPTAVICEYTCGAAGALDEYSTYLTGGQLEDVYAQIEGNFVGLGIELKADKGALLIVNTIPGSPAEREGLRPGDRIVAVNGQSTKNLSADGAADVLKGEEGTTVEVTVVTQQGRTNRLRIERQRVEVPSVEGSRIVDQQYGIGYLQLNSFQKTTNRDMDAALWKLHREGMRSLIVDVRGNPGGLLTSSVEVADKFVFEGTITSTRGRNTREDQDYKAHRVGTWRVPLVVLIDRNTASAGEIFAAAIHDHRRGEILGQRTYGKGSVQGIFPLSRNRAGVRLTTAKFYGPSGRPISKLGVSPNVVVRRAAKPITDGKKVGLEADDPVLAAAVQTARRRLSSGVAAAN